MSKVGPIVFSTFIALFFGAMIKDKADIDKQKREIAEIDSARYENACKRVESQFVTTVDWVDFNQNACVERNFWKDEYKAVKDSVQALMTDSANRAYRKTSQIAGDTVKTALKSVK